MAALSEVLEVFNNWDLNGDGTLSQVDLEKILGEIGIPKEDSDAIFASADLNKDGKINHTEFLSWIFLDAPMLVQSACGVSPDSEGHVQRVERAFPFQAYIEQTEFRAIQVQQLRKVIAYAEKNCCTWWDTAPATLSATGGQTLDMTTVNLYHLSTWLIMPATKKHNCAMVELLATTSQRPAWFISHWWGEPICDFLRCMEKHVEIRGLTIYTAFWVCAYANRQHALAREVTADPTGTSFFKALQVAEGVLLVLDTQATAFQRIWCVFEIYVALTSTSLKPLVLDIATCQREEVCILTQGVTPVDFKRAKGFVSGYENLIKKERDSKFSMEVLNMGLCVHFEKGQASVEADRRHILNAMAKRDLEASPLMAHEVYDEVNSAFRGRLAIAAWPRALQLQRVFEMGLPKALRSHTTCSQLDLCFFGMAEVENESIQALASHFPPQLKKLKLNLLGCNNLSDVGIKALGNAVQNQVALRWLSLNFRECVNITDDGLRTLSEALQAQNILSNVSLNFRGCKTITDAGLLALSNALQNQSALSNLHLNLAMCPSVSDVVLISLSNSLRAVTTLTHLDFIFGNFMLGCLSIGDAGLTALSMALQEQKTLIGFRLNVGKCTGISDTGVHKVSEALQQHETLAKVFLEFHGCTNITDKALEAAKTALSAEGRIVKIFRR